MTQRLATEYMKAVLEIDQSEFTEFVRLFEEKEVPTEIQVLDNGDREVILFDREKEVPLTFKRVNGHYELDGSFRISDLELAGILRQALKKFKGYAIVHRIYANFTMVYHYENGVVIRISEKNRHYERVIYEYKNPAIELEKIYQRDEAEREIAVIKEQINVLLDRRIRISTDSGMLKEIDEQLMKLSRRLFALEA